MFLNLAILSVLTINRTLFLDCLNKPMDNTAIPYDITVATAAPIPPYKGINMRFSATLLIAPNPVL